MSEWTLRLCHRPAISEPEVEQYSRLVKTLRVIPAPWGIGSADAPSVPPTGEHYSVTMNLSKLFGKAIRKCVIRMPVRQQQYLRDDGAHDDIFALVFNTKHSDFNVPDLVQHALPGYIDAWQPYLVELYDAMKAIEDAPVDSRHSVGRFWPINFWDAELCRRAFNLTPTQIVERLKGHVEKVEMLGNGVFVVVVTALASPAELDELDSKLARLLS